MLMLQEGFALGGSEERTCQENGDWSGERTTCQSKNLFFSS